MYANEVQRHGLYEEFHMSGRRTARNGDSTVDSLIFGRDIDGSGEAPHESGMGRFQGLAGKPSHQRSYRPSKKLAPKEDLLTQQADRPAGFRQPQDRPNRKGAGCAELASAKPGLAGLHSASAAPRAFRGQTHGNQAQADEVIFGRDTDMSGPDPQRSHFRSNFGSHAGLKTGERSERPYRTVGISQMATVDDVVFHRDMDGSGESPQIDHFTARYGDHAGRFAAGSRVVAKHVDPRDPSFKKGKGAPSTTFAPPGRTQSQPGSYAPSDDGRSSGRLRPDASSYAGSSVSTELPMARTDNIHMSMPTCAASEASTSDAGVSVVSRSSCPSSRPAWR